MRIEPTNKSLPRQSSGRRRNPTGLSSPAHNRPSQSQEATIRRVESVDVALINAPDDNTTGRLGSKRWRSHVPFIAQYIGQETAVETPERRARRHSVPARKAYQERTSLPPSPRTVAHI